MAIGAASPLLFILRRARMKLIRGVHARRNRVLTAGRRILQPQLVRSHVAVPAAAAGVAHLLARQARRRPAGEIEVNLILPPLSRDIQRRRLLPELRRPHLGRVAIPSIPAVSTRAATVLVVPGVKPDAPPVGTVPEGIPLRTGQVRVARIKPDVVMRLPPHADVAALLLPVEPDGVDVAEIRRYVAIRHECAQPGLRVVQIHLHRVALVLSIAAITEPIVRLQRQVIRDPVVQVNPRHLVVARVVIRAQVIVVPD